MTDRRYDEAIQVIHNSADLQMVRPLTIAALGGLVACALLVVRDPAAREIARDRHLRECLHETIQRLSREASARVEGVN